MSSATTFTDESARIADEVAAVHADDVDKEARFPDETFDALKEAGALSALVPEHLAAAVLGSRTRRAASFELGRRCGASGLVFAMHQIQVACLVRHSDGSELVRGLPALARTRAAPDRLRDVGGGDGRRHRALDRGRHAGRRDDVARSRSRRRPSATAPTPTTS